MSEYKPADAGRARQYDRSPMSPLKFLWADGSITDSLSAASKIISGPDATLAALYDEMPAIPVKWLKPDGTVLNTPIDNMGEMDLSDPGPIGGTTPDTGVFTTLGATSANITTIGGTTPGTINGKPGYVDHSTSEAILAVDCYGKIHNVTAAATLTCPEFLKGMNFTVKIDTAHAISVKCAAGSKFVWDLVLRDLAGKLTSDGSAYAELLIRCDADGVAKAYAAAAPWTYAAS